MNGAILYPTDDDIIALKLALWNIEANKEDAKEFIKCMSLFIEAWNIAWWRIVFNLEPLKINETVLG